MKMSKEHFTELEKRVIPFVPKIAAHREILKNDPKVKDLDTRVIWDVFHAARIYDNYSYREFDYTDAHIETAMRKILAQHSV